MADFTEIRAELDAARAALGEKARQLHQARLALARLETRRRGAEREAGKDAAAAADQEIALQKAAIGDLGADLGDARAKLADRLESFEVFSDPRDGIAQLSDAFPILLLPLRLETRFKPKDGDATAGGELWVRAYPDDIAVDAFEATLSESERLRIEAYWVNIWRSGGNEGEDRGAWAVLAGAAGAGRAHWLTRNYLPKNAAEKPLKTPGDPAVFLVIPVHEELADPELSGVRVFWEAFWRAGGDPGLQQSAVKDLENLVGPERAAVLRKDYAPANLADPPPPGDPDAIDVDVLQLIFPAAEEVVTREGGWSQAPRVDLMPDRLVLIGYQGSNVVLEELGRPIPPSLQVGPDPAAPESEHLRPEGEEIFYGDELAWIADFDKAVAIGMGFKVALDPLRFSQGFDRLMVLGVRLADDEKAGQAALENLFDHHHHGRTGLSIVPQGRPTNNVEDGGAAYSWREDPNVSFDHYFGHDFGAGPADDPAEWNARSDGRRLAAGLGLKSEALQAIPFYGHHDVGDAFAANTALWPATIGYFMDSMLDSVFDTATVEKTRDFFTRHVTARGNLPAIRVGKQPYGILPATPRSRMSWLFAKPITYPGGAVIVPTAETFFLRELYPLLLKVDADWENLRDEVAFIGKQGNPHQNLLDVVGLHPASVEFYQRYAESAQHLYNQAQLSLFGPQFWSAIVEYLYVQQGLELLGHLGWRREPRDPLPDILEKLFLDAPNRINRELIDDRLLSETDKIRAYASGNRNYLTWLADAAGTSHDALRKQEGFTDGVPTALFYLMLHHALDLSFVEVSRLLYLEAQLLTAEDYRKQRRDTKFFHIADLDPQDPNQRTGSRWDLLYRSDAAVTKAQGLRVAEYIPTIVKQHVATAYLARQLDALRQLENLPTAALERLFVEHLDLCSYRLDAWWGGVMSHQLALMRGDDGGEEAEPSQGLYLGAYGWLENVRPENKQLTPVDLDGDLAAIFAKPGEPPLERDDKNAGYIHAPSLNHAVTAAILRNGYLSNADKNNPGSLAINLSSERVRLALGIVEGMRGEQSLAALLGYQFERGLHDRHDVEVDEFIYDLRKVFPLRADRFATTKTGEEDELGRRLSARDVEARNVIDGLSLIEHIRATGNGQYPFGKNLPAAGAAQKAAISAEANRIANIADAIADLAMAESVHQVAQGNYERAGATLDTFSKGKFPAIPDVVSTPRSGVTLTHRLALHLDSAADPADPTLASPRAKAEPALDRWLAGILPPPERVVCTVTVTDPFTGAATEHQVSQADLRLAPSDLLYGLDPENQNAMRGLDDQIALRVRTLAMPRPNAVIAIDYRGRIPAIAGHVPFFELAALVRSCRALLLRSRPLRATDLLLANEATRKDDAEAALDIQRPTLVRADLAAHRGALEALRAALAPKVAAASPAQIAPSIDADVATFAAEVLAISAFAHPDLGSGSVVEERGRIYGLLHQKLRQRIASWENKRDAFDAAIAAYVPADLADDDARFIALHQAESQILAVPSDRPPDPFTPADFFDQLTTVTRPKFLAVLGTLEALRDNEVSLGGLYADLAAAKAAIAPHDVEPLDLAAEETALVNLASDLEARAKKIVAAADLQLTAAAAQIEAHDAALEPKEKLKQATAAVATLLGKSFLVFPTFVLAPAQAQEWGKAWGPGPAANTAILDYLVNDRGRPLPVEDWAAGVARVREKVRHLERAEALSEALRGGAIPLQPLQLPHRDEDYWLGLEHPPTKADGKTPVIDEDKLLYTASYATPFAATGSQAGLLLDEWTEVIPSRTEDTGLAIHYDRPSTEPPQVLLLALPADFRGAWSWQDLVDTVTETMDLAKRRAIEPTQIDATAYARFLPATVAAVTLHPISASLNFAFNNQLAAALVAKGGK